MKGKNLLRINQATLVEALQEHFDRVMPGQKVLMASRDGVSGEYGTTKMLEDVIVEFEAIEPAKTEAQGGAAQ